MGDSGARLRLPVWRSNDFALADATAWPTVGRDLLDEVMRRAESAGFEKAIVVSGPASVDKAKTALLRGWGYVLRRSGESSRLSRAIGACPRRKDLTPTFGPAPPVYDPGGLTALALRIEFPSAVQRFEEFAAASGAVVAIVPAITADDHLRTELDRRELCRCL